MIASQYRTAPSNEGRGGDAALQGPHHGAHRKGDLHQAHQHAILGLQLLVNKMERISTHDAAALQDYCPS